MTSATKELELRLMPCLYRQKDFTWVPPFNLSHNKNKVQATNSWIYCKSLLIWLILTSTATQAACTAIDGRRSLSVKFYLWNGADMMKTVCWTKWLWWRRQLQVNRCSVMMVTAVWRYSAIAETDLRMEQWFDMEKMDTECLLPG